MAFRKNAPPRRSAWTLWAIAIALSAVLAAVAFNASAIEVFKCKGTKGETLYQNSPCPGGAAPIAHGNYEPQPDAPTQAYAAADEAERIQQERLARRENALRQLQAIEAHEDSASSSAAAVAQAERIEKYRETRRTWGRRMAGAPPAGYEEAVAGSSPRRHAPNAPATLNCNPTGGGNVTCFGSDGSISNGRIEQSGSSTLFRNDGAILNGQVDGGGNATYFESGAPAPPPQIVDPWREHR